MENQHLSHHQNMALLQARIATLEASLQQAEDIICERDVVLSGNIKTIAKLTSDNEKLSGDNEKLAGDNEKLSGDNEKLSGDNEKLIEDTQRLTEKVKKLTGDVEYKEFQLEQLRRIIYGTKSERFIPQEIPGQLSLPFESEQVAKIVKEEQEKIRIEYERNKTKKAHPGRMSLPSHLPVKEVIIEPIEDTSDMICIGQEVTEELDYTPAKLHINRYIRKKYITKEDDKGYQKQVIAPLNRPLHKCIASVRLLSMILINKYLYHLPVYRTRQMLIKMGVTISDSTLDSWIRLGANLLKPLYQVHRQHVFREIYQMVDESPIKVQDKTKKGMCHLGYMWVRFAPLTNSVLFDYHKSRSVNGSIDDLKTFSGYVQTDGYSGYSFLAQKAGITHLSCWAHARRYVEAALKDDRQRASQILELIQVLYAIEALAREKQLSYDERYKMRIEKSLPVINQIAAIIDKCRNSVIPKSPMGKAIDYMLNRWISLQNYLKNGMLEIDSNLVENAIRPLAVGRKNYLFAGSQQAAPNIAMFYSFFETCKKQEIDPEKWLNYVLNNIGNTSAENFKELLPQVIDKSLIE